MTIYKIYQYACENFSLIGIALICLIYLKRIRMDPCSLFSKYRKLPAGEQADYDPEKIKRLGVVLFRSILWFSILVLFVDYFNRGIKETYEDFVRMVFILELLMLLLACYTRLGLDLFCRRGK